LQEGTLSRLISNIQNVIEKSRYALFAGAMLSTVALVLPQWSAAASFLSGRSDDATARSSGDGTIVVAEAEPKAKAKAPAKKETPKEKKETKQAPKEPPKAKAIPKSEVGETKGAPKGKQPPAKNVQKNEPKNEPRVEPRKGEAKGGPKGKGEPKGAKGGPQPKIEQKNTVVNRTTTVRNVEVIKTQRVERVEGTRTIITEPGNRTIIRDGGRVFIQHDDGLRFERMPGARVERVGGEVTVIVRNPDGSEIVTVTDGNGRLLRRIRRFPDRREVILIDNRPRPGAPPGFFLTLAPPVITLPRERYIVNVGAAPPALLLETLTSPPLVPIERAYTLDEIRFNVALRDRMRRIDIDSINFESGSWEVSPDQVSTLQAVAEVIKRAVGSNPAEVFMVEGHTDAVGADVDNLSLSDRRAESVATILTSDFQIPAENLVTQGYGEQFLKVPTQGPLRENRRVTIRRITPLLAGK
jgi:outer membrane protein OmpA-like peptidoglycan-associated protein